MVAPVKAAYRIAVLSTLLSACASVPPQQQRLVVALPPPVSVPVLQAPTPVPAEPASTAAATAPAVVVATPLPPAAPPQAPKSGLSDAEGRALLLRLLPPQIKDRSGWASDIFGAFSGLKIPYTPEYFCAAMAVIEQESSWQGDPPVPGLNRLVWKQIALRADKYHIPMLAVQAALLKPSPDGRSYKARIDSLQTEKQMNAVFEDMVADAGKLGLPLNVQNPIRTGGPMQVSVEFADGHVRVWPYPYQAKGSMRHEVFSRRGGVYFGVANLLHYRASYPEMIYRFADYNAGRYSSRNAAFQLALARLSGQKLALDGDLLRYDNGRPAAVASGTEKALLALGGKLGIGEADIRRDLQQEKAESFGQTRLFNRVFELAERQAGHRMPREVLPQIRLNSPKITRKLTTEWFAKRVDGRYQTCLKRAPAPVL